MLKCHTLCPNFTELHVPISVLVLYQHDDLFGDFVIL